MKKKHFWLIAITLTLAVFCSACHKKENLSITKNELVFSPYGGEDIIPITADCEWFVEVDETIDWIKATPTSGKNNGAVVLTISKNDTYDARNAVVTIVSSTMRTRHEIKIIQDKIDFVEISNKYWFLYEYERWATDYKDEYIEDSYEHWSYYIHENFDNWFFYFLDDSTGYQIHTKDRDTVIYLYDYIYYPLGDSLYINFQTDTIEVEDYHATINLLNIDRFQFSDEFYPHRFENLYLANISEHKNQLYINPKKVMKKEKGPLIIVEP